MRRGLPRPWSVLPTPVGAAYVVADSDSNLRESVILALSWTIADLVGRDVPGRDELAIALAMRRGEQPGSVKREAVGP
jgi:hypothetical protein